MICLSFLGANALALLACLVVVGFLGWCASEWLVPLTFTSVIMVLATSWVAVIAGVIIPAMITTMYDDPNSTYFCSESVDGIVALAYLFTIPAYLFSLIAARRYRISKGTK